MVYKRLQSGAKASPIKTRNVFGGEVTIPNSALTHIQFLRFAGCPVCNLLLQSYIKRIDEIGATGIREVVFFHSEADFIKDYHGVLPFDLVADPQKHFYRQYNVEKSIWAIMSPSAWPNLIKGYRLRPAGKQDSSPLGLPAEFLIDSNGIIIASHYGSHSSDQWSVDDVLHIAKSYKQGG